MVKKVDRKSIRQRRHMRIRQRIKGTEERPRLSVYKSITNIYAQIIDDVKEVTLVSASTLDGALKSKIKSAGNKEAAKEVGKLIGQKAKDKGSTKGVFDRGGNIYHGRIKELADGAREAGLDF